jgi:hypothetical protein
MEGLIHEDSERLARRFHVIVSTLAPRLDMPRQLPWEEVDWTYRRLLVQTFDEMLRSELIFPGPSLYADPSV